MDEDEKHERAMKGGEEAREVTAPRPPRRLARGSEAERPPRRLAREEKTLATMIGMYCRDHHGTAASAAAEPGEPAANPAEAATHQPRTGAVSASQPGAGGGLCDECAALLGYARTRLERCPFGVDKPTCAKCTTHCYKPAMREQVRTVMRYAGPRMVKEHPLLAAAHLADGRRRTPPRQ